MTRILARLLTVFALVAVASPASAQLLAAKDGPIVYGHLHLNPSNIPETRKFWADTLGGTVITVGTNKLEIIRFPNALVFWRANQAPTGGSKGTTVDHIGFSVPSLRPVLDRVLANGFRVVTQEEIGVTQPANTEVRDGIAILGGRPTLAFVMGPDGAKVELLEQANQKEPIKLHHQHFLGPQNREMRDWYAKVFGATPADGGRFPTASLPGIALNFSPSSTPVAGTTGRVYDHIGFEVKNLEAFTKQLEAQGIKLTVTYRRIDALNTAIAFVTDPWGTSIELSDGLAAIQ